jgi:DNA (cytosine-5)-methyltransferase 1
MGKRSDFERPFMLLDLFSGIGGFSFGLERSGNFKTVAFCEIEPFCRSVLRKHWPEVPIYEDVKELSADRLASDGIAIDAICGGFPCQDISSAGKGAGLKGERSGLWVQFHRLIKETRPKVAIIENVSTLRSRGLDQVLRSLAQVGYDAEWHCIPASAVGAPHRRDRIWILAYPNDRRCSLWRDGEFSNTNTAAGLGDHIGRGTEEFITRQWGQGEPRPYGVADGVSNRVDRLRALGNAVVPQITEMIGNKILEKFKNG